MTTFEHSLALHLFIRHGVDALADAFLDGCAAAVHSGAQACSAAYTRTRIRRAEAVLAAPRLITPRLPLDLRVRRLYRHSMS